MRRFILLLLVPVLWSPARAQTEVSEKRGKAVFDLWCAPCHGAVAPSQGRSGRALAGTAALAIKYQGKLPAVLEQRTDLTPAVIKTVVRKGLYGMPITRKTEVTDAQLDDVVAYLTRKR